MAKVRKFIGWGCAALLCLLGLTLRFGFPGFRFSAYIAFGMAGIAVCYQLLHILKKHRPKPARILFWMLTTCLSLGLITAVCTCVVIANAARGAPDTSCQYIIVLGAGVNGTVPSLSLRERLDAAYDYLCDHPDTVCIVSGGQGRGEDITEAQCMFDDLTRRGIEAKRVWMEDKATNTRENIAFSLALIENRTGSRPDAAGIVSSEYHLYRAGLFAGEQNLDPVGIPAKTSWPALRLNYFLREIFAVWYYILFGG